MNDGRMKSTVLTVALSLLMPVIRADVVPVGVDCADGDCGRVGGGVVRP